MINNSKIKELLAEAWIGRRQEKYDEAKSLVDEAQKLCSKSDYDSLGRIYHVYMQFESDHDNLLKALALCKKSLSYYKKTGNKNKIAHSTRHVADLERHLRREIDSERSYRTAIAIYRDNTNTYKGDLANALRGFAILLEKLKKFKEARETWKETKQLYQACNLLEGVSEAIKKLDSLS